MLLQSTMDWLPADSGRGVQKGSPAIRGSGRLHGFRLRLCLVTRAMSPSRNQPWWLRHESPRRAPAEEYLEYIIS